MVKEIIKVLAFDSADCVAKSMSGGVVCVGGVCMSEEGKHCRALIIPPRDTMGVRHAR
jgi:hypothetical protein